MGLYPQRRESRECSRDTYPESYITEHTGLHEAKTPQNKLYHPSNHTRTNLNTPVRGAILCLEDSLREVHQTYSEVALLDSRCSSVNFGTGTSPVAPKWCAQIDRDSGEDRSRDSRLIPGRWTRTAALNPHPSRRSFSSRTLWTPQVYGPTS